MCLFLYMCVCERTNANKTSYEHWAQVAISCFAVLLYVEERLELLYIYKLLVSKVRFLHENYNYVVGTLPQFCVCGELIELNEIQNIVRETLAK